ncbi:MAG: hypothetical protein GX159_09870 [Flavobacteriaceae bacterium]|jgi:hypothetical protein|nr:hypothetical protein [Flavobacteriaceae bacterium]
MSRTINLKERYAAAFGMLAVGYISNSVAERLQGAPKEYGLESYPFEEPDFEYIKFEVPELEPLEFGTLLKGESGNIFAPPLIITFSQEKTLVETEVNDSDGIVIERWGTKPYDLSIRGILIDVDNRIYPSDEIRRLNQNWKHNGVVKAIGVQFEEKDIDSIYFTRIEFAPVEGFQDTIQVNIEAKSIKAVNFTLLNPNMGIS